MSPLWAWRNPAAIRIILAVVFQKFLKHQELRASFAQAAGSFQESYGPDLQLLLSSTHLPAAETKSQRSPAYFGYPQRGLSVMAAPGKPHHQEMGRKSLLSSLARLARRGGWHGASGLPASCQVQVK
ncbi:unnamed protein product [Symbiodinium sp. CCMP2592]|nr:unnamed protein product [Symbiodinium sp. CCMP2592]